MAGAEQVDGAVSRVRRRRAALVGLGAAALAMHALLLNGTALWWPLAPTDAPRWPAAPVLAVRTIAPPKRVEPVMPALRDDPSPARSPARSIAATPRATPATPLPPRAPPGRPALLALALARPMPPLAIATAPVVSAESAHWAPRLPSLDRTEVAPSTRLRYRATRGARMGSAELQWQVADGAYEARLEIVLEGSARAAVLQVSRGRIDASGVAPERYTDRRLTGGMQAASFERETGTVSFSGPAWRLPLTPGVQDRLSWLLQLAAVVAADPARASAQGEVVIPVVGVRGEGRDWRFRFDATDGAPAGTVGDAPERPTQKWLREPVEPYDTRVEVWLDPARHHLPVRLRMGPASGAAAQLELTLDE
ncbi:MAG: DUF3108 domain-containing protein [Burkholderiaceae bacterium]